MIFRPIETHTHTVHSDGDFTVEELIRACYDFGYAGMILSDHNTDSGYQEVTEELVKKYLPVIRAIEWTTYFGHVLVIGANRFVDWRFAKPETIDTYFAEIVKADGVVGIAHPFSMGGVLYTGGFIEFQVHDWTKVSFIEVFSKAKNTTMKSNARALEWWFSLLNEGHHLAITSGRDWHRPDPEERPVSVTYVGVENDAVDEAGVKEALRKGRTYVTYGAGMNLSFVQGGKKYMVGDSLVKGPCTMNLSLDFKERSEHWQKWNYDWRTVRVIADGRVIKEVPYTAKGITVPLDGSYTWAVVGVYGTIGGSMKEEFLAMSSPVYFE